MTDIKVPSPGESISEVEIGNWLVESGAYVERDQDVVSLESEKASLTASAPEGGVIEILVANGTRVAVGSIIARIDEKQARKASPQSEKAATVTIVETVPAVQKKFDTPLEDKTATAVKVTPVARELMDEHNLSVDDILNGLRRITKSDVQRVISATLADAASPGQLPAVAADRAEDRKKMSLLREKLSLRLVAVKNETAMLTTFNEVDMTAVMELRNRFKGAFEEKHKVKLGFMSFFTMAASRALIAYPQVNSVIEGNEIISFNYTDIGIAVQTPKGLMVPVLRNTQLMTLAGIEQEIARLAAKARENKISIEELRGGTFSITNGGVYGSLLSTPILNPPQPAILGMHNIVDRPVALAGQVVIRPMMYLALSYDHRLIDGKDSVGFLRTIKELIENPVSLLDPAGRAEKSLLGI
jgi:2-oxoglutarate dehydrogenase E2 component (dihydrolipoamide succinyltransferase)